MELVGVEPTESGLIGLLGNLLALSSGHGLAAVAFFFGEPCYFRLEASDD